MLQITINNVGNVFQVFCTFQRIFRLVLFFYVVQKQILG